MTLDSSVIQAYKSSGSPGKEKHSQAEDVNSVSNSQYSSTVNGSGELEHSFAIGDDEDVEDSIEPEKETRQNESFTSEQRASIFSQESRSGSISSSVDEAIPTQLRGMSEKARGKLPAEQRTSSRQKSMIIQNGLRSASDGQGASSEEGVSEQHR